MSSKKSAPGPSKSETRAEQTTAIANEIIGRETSERAEKTERLRAARLERDAKAPETTPRRKTKKSQEKT
ncbi:hypothetical protein OCH239_00035 [Roseivivax halodurans JCM 10272]|uniref:Uncharacterized protein n=1 Tax=Roseivivax halodurans JCM 10272 TaxID=1449350 RepID=X7EJI8_9RHOB|nr:hypothetical protein [Roseivivax halodurans]ETX16274.1 hypothetical protein OCH239_00035 [Roseivivax halodurans JCM 10272]